MRRIVGIVLLVLVAAIVVLNWTWGRLPGDAAARGSFVRVDGVRVHYVERSGAEPAVVLIHGLPGTADDFDKVTPLLRGHRTIAYDRPGYGFSDGGYHPMDRQVTVLRELLDRLRVRRPVLVGHSYGGTLALAYAEQRPQDLSGLVLVDAAAGGAHSTALRRAQSHLVQVLSWPVVQPLADATFSQLLRTASAKSGDAQAFDPGDVDETHEDRVLAINMRHEDLDAYAAEQLHADDVIANVDKKLASIQTPAVVIHGAGDKLIEPEHGRRLAAALPHARLVMVSGGHMAPYVHPAIVAAAVRELSRPVTRPRARPGRARARSAAR
jgi:pimeloyl-ACP methyl ester carboxylesterase